MDKFKIMEESKKNVEDVVIRLNKKIDNSDPNFAIYNLYNTNHSIVNALRRTILSDIPLWVFNGFPKLIRGAKKYEPETIQIFNNTTRLNNEIIKQRLANIPIHLNDKIDYSNYIFSLNVPNKNHKDITHEVKYITTNDFDIYENEDNLKKKIKKNVNEGDFNPFPPFVINSTKNFILITRLNPKISDQIPEEKLELICKLTKHTAKENGCFNAVSCCSYSYLQDISKLDEKWNEFCGKDETKLKDPNERKNWNNLNGKRVCHKDKFKFIIESLGIYSCKELLIKACKILIKKLKTLNTEIKMSMKSLKHAIDIILINEDYTIGKVLEYVIYENLNELNLSYVGFEKKHPHDTDSTIRIILNLSSSKDDSLKIQKNLAKEKLTYALKKSQNIFINILNQLEKN